MTVTCLPKYGCCRDDGGSIHFRVSSQTQTYTHTHTHTYTAEQKTHTQTQTDTHRDTSTHIFIHTDSGIHAHTHTFSSISRACGVFFITFLIWGIFSADAAFDVPLGPQWPSVTFSDLQ